MAHFFAAQHAAFDGDEAGAKRVALADFGIGTQPAKADAKADAKEPEEKKAGIPLPERMAALTEVPRGVALAEVAAWTSVARVLLNLDEFITRE